MLNYNIRTIEPIVSAIVDEMHRKFLTKTARTQGQAILFFRNPFALATVENLSNVATSFTQNEILSSDEIRALLGYKPHNTNRSQELSNKNINPIANDPDAMNPVGVEGQNENQDEMDLDISLDEIDIDSLSEEELQEYIDQLEAYDLELDELVGQTKEG